jgi:hypothetical protein
VGCAISRSRARWLLAGLLAAGLVLRLWGLDYGLPHPSARPDEEVFVARFLGFDAGDPNPHWFVYPTLSFYLFYAWLKGALLAGAAIGAWSGPTGLAALLRSDPTTLYLVARAASAAAGTATIAATWALGRATAGRTAGLVAALLTAVSFLQVRESHFFKPDALFSLFTTLALLGAVLLQRDGTRRAAVVAGIACGLVVAVKYGVLVLVAVAAAVLLGPPAGGRVPSRLARGALAVGAAAATFVVASPYVVLAHEEFLAAVRAVRVWLGHAGEGVGAGFGYHARYAFLAAHGLPLTVVMLGALAWGLRVRALLPVVAFAVVSLVQLGLAAAEFSRYVTPVLPALYVVTGAAIARGLARVAGPRVRSAVAAGVLAALVARPLYAAVRFDQIAAAPDTRLLATAWLRSRVPTGTAVLVLGAPWPYVFGDPVLDGFRVYRNPRLDPALGIRWVVTHEHPIPYSRVPPAFEALRPALRLEATISPFAGTEAWDGAVFELRDAFYVPIAGFAGVARGGPLIRIYSVAPGEGRVG